MTTCDCGASLPESAPWCSQCHLPRRDPRFVPVTDAEALLLTRRDAEPVRAERAPRRVHGRFDATEVTFGLRGRLVTTLLLLVPIWWSLQHFFAGGWLVLGVWLGLLLPWALRDTWRRSDRL